MNGGEDGRYEEAASQLCWTKDAAPASMHVQGSKRLPVYLALNL